MEPTFKLTQEHVKPESQEPLGDRYLIKILEVDDTLQLQSGHTLHIPTATEKDRGWKAGVIVTCGNGHRLSESDKVAVMANVTSPEDRKAIENGDKSKIPPGAQYLTDDAVTVRPPAMVPMFYSPGDVVLVERFAGRDMKLGPSSHDYCIVAQEHCLSRIKGLKLLPNNDGEWREFKKPEAKLRIATGLTNGVPV